jgi:hypothetical protein
MNYQASGAPPKFIDPFDFIKIQENYLIKCKHCKSRANYNSVSLTFMRHHIETEHPDKVTWKLEKE